MREWLQILRFTLKIHLKTNSATGKTTLVEMIREYYEDHELSGIQLEASVPCRTLSGRDWSIILPSIENSIVFIDEDNDFLRTEEFAEAIRNSSNYYVIVTREGLSTDVIFGVLHMYSECLDGVQYE